MTIYIYGVGQLSKFVAAQCAKLGISVEGFVDNMVQTDSTLHTDQLPSGAEVWICVLNNFADIKTISTACADAGASRVLFPPQIFELLGEKGVSADWYWLTSSREELLENISKTNSILGQHLDQESKEVLEGIHEYRLNGNPSKIMRLPIDRQYLDTGIDDFWIRPDCFVDCGSFTGDTLEALFEEGHIFKEVIAFEPDVANFKKLQETAKSLPIDIKCFPTAISDSFKFVNFSGEGSSGSRVLKGEGNTIALSLDEALPGTKISHVKMDLEGGELDALKGMEQALKRCRPNLAIAVYHKPDDLWKIPEYISSLEIYSTFSLRTYAEQGFETILYCTPQ